MSYVVRIPDSAPDDFILDLEWGISLSRRPENHMTSIKIAEDRIVEENVEVEVPIVELDEITNTYVQTGTETRIEVQRQHTSVVVEERQETTAPQQVDLSQFGVSDIEASRSVELQRLLADRDLVRVYADTDLRIAQYIRPEVDVMSQDFSILPLRKVSPQYEKGRKISAEYLDSDGEVVVRKVFSDIENESGILSGLLINFEWFTFNGLVGLRKVQVAKEYTAAEVETVLRQRRERQIDFLIAGAKGTPIAPAFQKVFEAFATQIKSYIGSGSFTLAQTVRDHDGAVADVLDTEIGTLPDNVTPYTIRMAILKELGDET